MNQNTEEMLYWFESFVEQSLTFNSWKKIETKFCQILKQNLEKKLMDPVNRQILFQMLGNEFVNKHFSSYTNTPAILDNVRKEEKIKKSAEMKSLIVSIIESAAVRNGPKTDNKICSDITNFSKDLNNLIDIDYQEKLSEIKSKKKQKLQFMSDKHLLDILRYQPQTLEYLIPKLKNELAILSDELRHLFWPFILISKEKNKNKKNSEKIKEKFISIYNKALENDSFEVDYNDIISATKKAFKETNCLKSIDSEDNIKAIEIILIVCNNYGRKFLVQYVYYAIIIQQVYLKEHKKLTEEDYGLATMILEKILRLCFINTEQTNNILSKVLQSLEDSDKELFNHIKEKMSSQIDNTIDPSNEKNDINISSKDFQKKHPDFNFFMTRWISHAFTSVLKPNALFFIWDQLFLNKWENKTIYHICLALLGLLKPWFMLAKNQADIEKVFFEEPGFLYLLDIRKALGHIQKNGAFSELASLNRNIKLTTQPVQPPPPTPPKVITPPPPKPDLPPPRQFLPWVPYNKELVKNPSLGKYKVDSSFDLYIDSIRFVPDNSTVIKVTGKILNMYLGQRNKSIKFQTYPELDSFWRYPNFKLKQTINRETLPMNPDVVVMMRIYTIEKYSKKECVIGSCLFGPFSNKHGKQATLRCGGHQIRIRHGIPDPDFTIEHMLASHMDDNPIIPGVTILLRILPHENDYIPPPEYESNYYRSELAKPNESENKLYKYYQTSKDFTMTVRDVALLLCGNASANDHGLNELIQKQLQKEGSDIEDFPYERFVDYNKEDGIMIIADKAYGLPLFLEGRYLQCLVQVYPGEDSKIGDGKAQVTSFLTEELELESPQRAPDWSDQPKVIKPDYDDKGFILISLYGIRPYFDPITGKVRTKEGKEPKFSLQHAIAWSAVTCFDKNAVHAGIHQIPLFRGRPSDDLIQKLCYLPLDYICKKFKSQIKMFESASIEISLWDGRFISSECPPLPTHTNLLYITPNPEKFIKALQRSSGASAYDLLKQGLTNPTDINTYKNDIVKALKIIFKTNLDDSLEKAGYSQTI